MAETLARRVLVVDDNMLVRDLAVEFLSDAGYRTWGAGNAVEAIRHLTERDFDLIFTDIAMPGLSGFALVRQAKQLQPGLRVVFTTGFIPPEEWDEQRYGPVLRKPYSARQLIAEIARAMAS
jgi:CheY-like chemotaxis protein